MSSRVRLYAGPLARLRYATTSSLAKWGGVALLVLAIIGAVIGSIPYVPAMYERANAAIAEVGVVVRDDLTVADTLTPAHETAAALATRFGAYAQLRGHDACFDSVGDIPTTQRRNITLAQAHLEESSGALWVDQNRVAEHRIDLAEAWTSVLNEEEAALPGCVEVLVAG